MTTLAELGNVYCKLSGSLAYRAPAEATQAAINPYVEHVLEVFGPNRMVWGSDWPVIDLANGLSDWLSVTAEIFGQLMQDELAVIGANTAKNIFLDR